MNRKYVTFDTEDSIAKYFERNRVKTFLIISNLLPIFVLIKIINIPKV